MIVLVAGLVLMIAWNKIFTKQTPHHQVEAGVPASRYPIYFDGNSSKFAGIIKDHLHDPKSFDFVSSEHKELGDGDVEVIVTYRAKNGFGGVRTNRASATFNKNRESFRNVIIELD